MTDTLKNHLQSLLYYHEERGDMMRYCAAEEALQMMPKLRDLQLLRESLEQQIDAELRRLCEESK